jgi:glycosyltransferase involved in cell wall biosynthesis
MKIIFIDHSIQMSGGQISLMEFIKVIVSNSRIDEVVCIFNKENKRLIVEANRNGVQVIPFNFQENIFIKLINLLILFKKLNKINKRIIIYGNTYEGGVWSGIISKLIFRKSIFRIRLSPVIFSHGVIDHLIFTLNNSLIANSYFVSKETQVRMPYLNKDKIKVIYPPIEKTKFRERPIHREKKCINIGVIGRFEPIKKQIEIVEITKILSSKYKGQFKFYLFGSPDARDNGNYLNKVIAEINSEDIKNCVEIYTNITDTEKIYENLDICLTLSTVEALSRVLYEGALRGCVNVASSASGNVELISHGVDGFLFEPNSCSSAAKYISELISNYTLLSEFSKAGREKMLKLFSNNLTVEYEIDTICEL